MNFPSNSRCLLVDNGSVRAHALLFTRKIASRLEDKIGIPVEAVSLAHSDRISGEELQGVDAVLLKNKLQYLFSKKQTGPTFVLPLLLLTGGTIYQRIHDACQKSPLRNLKLADGLISMNDNFEFSIPNQIVRFGTEQVHLDEDEKIDLWIVDHGSPNPISRTMRDWVVRKVWQGLVDFGRRNFNVAGASMERRPGKQYEFNEPLLEDALRQSFARNPARVFVVKLMVQPGSHAGKRGDIDEIINDAKRLQKDIPIICPPSVFSQKDLTELLKYRLSTLLRE